MYPQSMEDRNESRLTLPSFRKPPLVEVALAIGFTDVTGLNFAALVDLHQRWKSDYPSTEEHPFLEPQPLSHKQAFRVESGPPPQRIWLVSPQKDSVLQIQRDRLIGNWRAVGIPANNKYPRYGALRESYLARWADFEKFVAERLGLSLNAEYAEVSYVNLVSVAEGKKLEIPDVLKMNKEGGLWQENAHTTAVTQSWDFPDMNTTVTMAANVDNSAPNYPVVLQLSATTRIDMDRSTSNALDLAHDCVVGTFGVVTTEKMQRRWERIEVSGHQH